MISVQIASTTGKLVSKVISALGAESLDGIMQCAYDIAHTRVFSVIYIVFEQNLRYLLR